MKTSFKLKLFIFVFFGIFILVGLGLAGLGLTKLALYNFAEQVDATVLSAQFNAGEMDVTFTFVRNGESIQASAHFDDVKYKNGELPYYEGKNVTIRINKHNQVLQFSKKEIIVTIGGVIFIIAGAGFIYFFFGNKNKLADISCDYKNAIVESGESFDKVEVYEAEAERLTELPQNSLSRMIGETGIWKNRIQDRFKVFSVWENIFFGILLILPMVILNVVPLFYGKKISVGYVLSNILIWLFIFSFVGMIFKIICAAYYKLLVNLGKFNEKKIATVVCSAFESSSSYQIGEFSRTYTSSKKFRVVAMIDGKRSVGYVKGAVPPSKGTKLKVFVRPHNCKRWIIDNS